MAGSRLAGDDERGGKKSVFHFISTIRCQVSASIVALGGALVS